MGLDTHTKRSHYSSSHDKECSDSEDDYSRSYSSSSEEEDYDSSSYSSEEEEEQPDYSSAQKPRPSKTSAKLHQSSRSSASVPAPTPQPRQSNAPKQVVESMKNSRSPAPRNRNSKGQAPSNNDNVTTTANASAPTLTSSNQDFTKSSAHMFEKGVHYDEKRDVHYTKIFIPLSAPNGETGFSREADTKGPMSFEFSFDEDIVEKFFKPDISDQYDDFMTSKCPPCDFEHAKIVHISLHGYGGDHPKALGLRFKNQDFLNGIKFAGKDSNACKNHLAVIPSSHGGAVCCPEILYDCKQQALESKSFGRIAHLSCKRIYQKDLRFHEFRGGGDCQVKCGTIIDDILCAPKHMSECGLKEGFQPRCEGKWNWYPADAVGIAMAKFQAKVLAHMRIIKWKDLTMEWMHADGSAWGESGLSDVPVLANDIAFNSWVELKIGFMYPRSEPEDCKPSGPSCHSTFLSSFKDTLGTWCANAKIPDIY